MRDKKGQNTLCQNAKGTDRRRKIWCQSLYISEACGELWLQPLKCHIRTKLHTVGPTKLMQVQKRAGLINDFDSTVS